MYVANVKWECNMSENGVEGTEVVEWTFLMTIVLVGLKVSKSWFWKSDWTSFEIYELHWSYSLEIYEQNWPWRNGVRKHLRPVYQHVWRKDKQSTF